MRDREVREGGGSQLPQGGLERARVLFGAERWSSSIVITIQTISVYQSNEGAV